MDADDSAVEGNDAEEEEEELGQERVQCPTEETVQNIIAEYLPHASPCLWSSA